MRFIGKAIEEHKTCEGTAFEEECLRRGNAFVCKQNLKM